MGTPGFSGKILLVNLTTRAMGSIESAKYDAFDGVFGSKNLKAIAVIGTGSIKVADPKAVRDSREWFEANFPMSGQRGPGHKMVIVSQY
jgi:hypothetical protein